MGITIYAMLTPVPRFGARVSTAGIAVCLACAMSGQRASPASASYRIGPAIQITSTQRDLRHYEAYIGASPSRNGNLIACDYVVRPGADSDDLFYVSHDSGETWKLVLTMPHNTDPSCAIDATGVLFAAGVSNGARSTLSVMRSNNEGKSWETARIPSLPYDVDRPYLTVAGTGSRGDSAILVHSYRFSNNPAALFFISRDGGSTFAPPVIKPPLQFAKPWYFVGNGVAASGGVYYSLLAELDKTKKNMSYRTDPASAPHSADALLEIFRSEDAGKRISLAGTIPGVYYDWRVPQLSMPSLALDETTGPHPGRLYVAWPDARYEQRTEILFAYSDDRGRTWSPARPVGEQSMTGQPNPIPNDFMPMIAVNRDGVVGISWYDRRNHPHNLAYDVRFAASLDGGETWLTSAQVSNAPFDPGTDTRKNGGDTAGLAADAAGIFHLAWIANPGGTPQMWTAAVEVVGEAVR